KAFWGLFGLVALCALALAGPGFAAKPPKNTVNAAEDTSAVPARLNAAPLPVLTDKGTATLRAFGAAAAAADPVVGEKRNWLALDDFYGFFYRQEDTLR